MTYRSTTPAKAAKYAQQMKTAANNLHANPDATISDLFRVAGALGVSAADLMRMVETR